MIYNSIAKSHRFVTAFISGHYERGSGFDKICLRIIDIVALFLFSECHFY